jgi:hypothetical protein
MASRRTALVCEPTTDAVKCRPRLALPLYLDGALGQRSGDRAGYGKHRRKDGRDHAHGEWDFDHPVFPMLDDDAPDIPFVDELHNLLDHLIALKMKGLVLQFPRCCHRCTPSSGVYALSSMLSGENNGPATAACL